jgi:hypothetical protein
VAARRHLHGLGGPVLGQTLPKEGTSDISYSDFEQGVTPGTHTVQSFVGSDHGLDVFYWTITYQVFAP